MVIKRGGEYRWSCEKLNGGLGRGSPKGCSYPDPVPVVETKNQLICVEGLGVDTGYRFFEKVLPHTLPW